MVLEEEEIQTKGISTFFNNIIAENFPTLRKGGTYRFKRFTEHQTVRTRKQTPPYIS
jgi:hypothetical protein